jgi:hypothetical protein
VEVWCVFSMTLAIHTGGGEHWCALLCILLLFVLGDANRSYPLEGDIPQHPYDSDYHLGLMPHSPTLVCVAPTGPGWPKWMLLYVWLSDYTLSVYLPVCSIGDLSIHDHPHNSCMPSDFCERPGTAQQQNMESCCTGHWRVTTNRQGAAHRPVANVPH